LKANSLWTPEVSAVFQRVQLSVNHCRETIARRERLPKLHFLGVALVRGRSNGPRVVLATENDIAWRCAWPTPSQARAEAWWRQRCTVEWSTAIPRSAI